MWLRYTVYCKELQLNEGLLWKPSPCYSRPGCVDEGEEVGSLWELVSASLACWQMTEDDEH